MNLIRSFNQKYRIVFIIKNIIADIFCKITLISIPSKWSVLIAERMSRMDYPVIINGKKFKLVSNSDLLLYRSKTFHEKEPETNLWIENMPKDGVFYDVGANVGIFSILAANYCKKVYAFEPVALNYSVLNQNLLANKLDDKVTAYCLALSNSFGFDTMRLSSGTIGSAHHTFGRNVDACHHVFSPVFNQGALAITLDDLVFKYQFECPTYLKIDVDGNEHLIIAGAQQLLKDNRLKSILIELNKNLQIDQKLIEEIKSNNFILKEEGIEAELNGMKIGNLIFYRS